jgi:hypothetical protein
MNKDSTFIRRCGIAALALGFSILSYSALASSHREAPLIARDPQADNTDVYAFRSPDDTNTVTIIANFIPFQLPEGGPNYYTFGTNVRYEIHIKNNAATAGDDITYRFTFSQANQDPTTFFNIRLGQQNLRTTYSCQKFVAGILMNTTNGVVPPPNIGPRSINGAVGLNASSYDALMTAAVTTAASGEKIFAGPVDDPFFVDLGGAFDVGSFRPSGPSNTTSPTKDGLARYNVNAIAIKVPISSLQKSGQAVTAATSILDPNFVIGVWASASRQQINTLNSTGGGGVASGTYIQVSRLGMPLTNEVVIPLGAKDRWNALTPYDAANGQFLPFFKNPELALYMDDRQFGGAVPSLKALRIQKRSRADLIPGGFDFGNGKKGLWPLKGSSALIGTALDPALFGGLLLPDSMSPRAVDIMPIFLTGVPNLAPYQLATGKAGGNPLASGKPFINNFLPAIGDMLRLNMAVPVTPRTSADFSSLGIVWAVVLGLTDARFNGGAAMQNIPNMDGFPNGRRLEDDVTTIELQAVSGVALAALGLWYDDYVGTGSPVTPRLGFVLNFNAGPTRNDTTFKTSFPYVQTPWRGYDYSLQARF